MYGGIKLSNVTVGLPGNKCQLFISDFQLLRWVCVVWVVPQVWFPWLTAEHAILQGYIIYSSSYIYIQPRAARLSILCERISNVSSMMHLARVRSCPLFDGIQRREQKQHVRPSATIQTERSHVLQNSSRTIRQCSAPFNTPHKGKVHPLQLLMSYYWSSVSKSTKFSPLWCHNRH